MKFSGVGLQVRQNTVAGKDISLLAIGSSTVRCILQ